MHRKHWFIAFLFIVILALALLTLLSLVYRPPTSIQQVDCSGKQYSGSPVTTGCQNKLLVFSKTGAYRHPSIKDGKIALQKLAIEHHFVINFSEDSTVFNDENLAQYRAVVFLMTTGNILDASQKDAFERYIRAGGGFVGIHSASDTEYDWAWYGGLVGAFNNSLRKHSSILRTTIHVEDRSQLSTSMLPALWTRTDEWYNFATNPRGRVHVLMTIDEKTYQGGTMGVDHPIAWYHQYDGGRAWYTALGHTPQSYYEPLFLAHIWDGVMYAAGFTIKASPSVPPTYSKLVWQMIEVWRYVADRASDLILHVA